MISPNSNTAVQGKQFRSTFKNANLTYDEHAGVSSVRQRGQKKVGW